VTSDKPPSRYAWLRDNVTEDTVVITASRRLARELTVAYNELQIASGKKAWPTPAIHFLQDWISRQLVVTADPAAVPRLLDPFSSSILWERCLKRRMPDGLLSMAGIVRQAGQTWQRIKDWNLSLPALLSSARNQDERLFARAAADYQERLDNGNWVDRASVASLVSGLPGLEKDVLPARVILAGFDLLSPVVIDIAEALKTVGCEVVTRPPPEHGAIPFVACFDQESSELRAAGAWARQVLRADPEARLAVVCPGLEMRAAEVSRLVREGLVPGWQYGIARHSLAVNVSYGRRLAEFPAIGIALKVLRWTCQGLSSRELSVLLRSRCVASESVSGRSRLELKLRGYPDRDWTPGNVLQVVENREEAADTDAFIQLVQAVADFSSSVSQKMPPAECVGKIDELLKVIRWPGEASLDSIEFQLVNRWRELLNEFARIESVVPQIEMSEAIGRVATLAQETVWQPEAEDGVVQVLGTLEAAGMEFDGVWVCSLDATQWPPPSRPSPFISLALQREHAMPDATPGDTLEFSRRVLQRLVGSSRECILSWSCTRDDAELTASTLLDTMETQTYVGPQDPGWYALSLGGPDKTLIEVGDKAPPVGSDEQVRGGAYTVQRQFTEPFSAFVSGRLGVRSLDPIATGLSASMRGNIIHNALHNLLADKPSGQQIQGWTTDEIGRRVGSAIDSALATHVAQADPVLQRLIGIERRRLRQLLYDFIHEEAVRPEFSVAGVEKKLDYEKFGIRLGLRIDRIDRLADGRMLVVDYKTGSPKTFLNRNHELKDLQLMVYADALDVEIGGLAFINVDSREITYKVAGGGWNEAEEGAWEETLQSWRAEVHQALEALATGDARINILQSASEGRPLSILSRLEELKRG